MWSNDSKHFNIYKYLYLDAMEITYILPFEIEIPVALTMVVAMTPYAWHTYCLPHRYPHVLADLIICAYWHNRNITEWSFWEVAMGPKTGGNGC